MGAKMGFVDLVLLTSALFQPQIVVSLQPVEPQLALPLELGRFSHVVPHESLDDVTRVDVDRRDRPEFKPVVRTQIWKVKLN